MTSEAILEANGLEDADSLAIGQKLMIPVVPTVTATAQAPRVYVVEEGDTLLAIALKFGVEVEDVMMANGLDDPNALTPGQKLVIP